MYDNPKRCAECGGVCCRHMAGMNLPSDFVSIESMLTALESGKYAIDCWEGDPRAEDDPRPDRNGLCRVLYIRPKHKGIVSLFDPSWGGECIFLTSKGCKLPPDKRPSQCQHLKPGKKGEDCVLDDDKFNKQNISIAWIPFQNLLDNFLTMRHEQ